MGRVPGCWLGDNDNDSSSTSVVGVSTVCFPAASLALFPGLPILEGKRQSSAINTLKLLAHAGSPSSSQDVVPKVPGSIRMLAGPSPCTLIAIGDCYSRVQPSITRWEFSSGAFSSP